MLLKIGQNIFGMVANAAPDTGAGADPTAITGALYRNGVLDAAVVITATDEAATAGITKLSGAVPGDYAEGDILTLMATATVGGVSSSWPVWHATAVTRLPGELLTAAGYTAPDNAGITAIAGYLDTEVAAIKAKTDLIPAEPAAVGSAMTLTIAYDAAKTAASQASVDDVPTLAEIEASAVLGKEATLTTIAGYLDTEIAAIKAKTDNLPAQPAAVGSAMTLTAAYDPAKTAATQASVDALWTTAIAEAYAADGAAPTPAQALCMILQLLAEKSVSGTTMTVKKLDGATTAMTFTLNDATAPTSITRAS